ncbi:multidrug effflux MFS transporter [Streptomyces sp. SID10853]|uniref:multidrug effflux MFS transporter n=1 Tax=Streptomyces sp. SID10853 TaxID=2706028 RepID=UPI0013BFBC0C|nr:multidrug effflux MFS transporter [Streptomyces sp. SID10853]NDZ80867.1 multidrug effflux MFS transporter [Streptomyces sp. SID10853]
MVSAATQRSEAPATVPHSPGTPVKSAASLVAVLAVLTATGPLAIDMYVPGFPEMQESLHAGSSAIQLTMTAILVGLVVGQLIIGPVSDSIGRRRLLIGGVLGYTAMSLVCAIAPNIGVLTAGRFLQGVAGAAGMVLARAILTDCFQGRDLPRYFALLSQILGAAPVVAPIVGGAVLAVSTWRMVFVVLAVISGALAVVVTVRVPETLPPERRHKGGLSGTFRSMGRLTGHRAFIGYVLVLSFGSAALFAYVSGSAFVFESLHGFSSTSFSMVFAVNAVGMLAAGAVFGKLAHRVPLNTLLTAGVGVAAAGALAQVLLVATAGETVVGSWISLFVVTSGIGMIFPASMSLGQTLGRSAPGAASALMGGVQFLLGAVASPLVGLFGESSSMPMAVIMLVSLALSGAALLVLSRPWLRHGEADRHSVPAPTAH